MPFSDNRKFWTEFIAMYRSLDALWDTKSKNYCNKHIRSECIKKLIKKCHEVCPESDESFVKKKIESFRCGFRRELRKVEESKKSCSSSDSVYEPTLWYYNLLHFIDRDRIINPEETTITYDKPLENNWSGEEGQAEDKLIGSPVHVQPTCVYYSDSNDSSLLSLPQTPLSTSRSEPQKRKKHCSTQTVKKKAKFLDIASAVLTNHTEGAVFCYGISLQLEKLEKGQRIFAEKLMSDVLFYAKLGKLTENSCVLKDGEKQKMTYFTHLIPTADSCDHTYQQQPSTLNESIVTETKQL